MERISPDDASWESWDDLKAEYHLDDKLLFERHQNVMEGTKQPSPEAQKTESQLANTNQRPKRLVTKPQYLKDFI